ncbi:MAG TPA: hypothetical protein VIJ75_20900 [Hanamia sp.]
MKNIFTLLFLYFVSSSLTAQQTSPHGYLADKDESTHNKKVNFTGQWKGGFNENNGVPSFDDGSSTRYVLELTIDGNNVAGYSYTYFQEMNKKYYTICRVTGSLNRSTNDVIVTEIERVKYNTPPDFGNCFQTHRLHYEKGEDNTEILTGTWIPAPNQPPTCGRGGTTTLSRRIVSDMPTGFMPHKTPTTIAPKENRPKQENSVAAAPKKNEATKKPHTKAAQATPELGNIAKATPIQPDTPSNDNPESTTLNKTVAPTYQGYETRRKDVVKTIEIEQPTFHIDFYDNGAIDGDSITVFYNGKIVLSNKRLSDKPISLDLTLDKNAKENIVTMYADNLGTIPPNTALMIVTDGGKRYEVRMESDYGKSGSVIFKSVK